MSNSVRFVRDKYGYYTIKDGDEVLAVHISGAIVNEILTDLKNSGYSLTTPCGARK